MSERLAEAVRGLTPERRRLLELMLRAEGVSLDASVILPRPRDRRPVPLSFAQQRLWFIDQLEPGSPQYNIPLAVRLDGPLSPRGLEAALNEIVRRHETLRTSFARLNGTAHQVIAPEAALPLPVTDLSGLPADRQEAEVWRRAQEEARAPFDLERGPLIRARLLRLGASAHALLVTMHHIVSDGWSMRVFVREIGTLYHAIEAGRPSPLAPLFIQYADFARWQRDWLEGERLERQIEYWTTRLAGAPALDLPADRPRPPVMSFRGATISRILPSDLLRALDALARQEEATTFMALMTAWQLLLARYSGSDDISVGTPIANRTRRELEPLIGFFVNTLVLRTDCSGDPSFRTLLRRVKAGALEAYQNQDVPFEQVVERLGLERDPSRTPLFQTMLILQNAGGRAGAGEGGGGAGPLRLRQIESHSGTSTFDLTLSASVIPDGLGLSLEYSTDLFEPATAAGVLAHFECLVESAVRGPDRPAFALPMLPEDERHRVLVEWNRTDAPRPDIPAHRLVERRAAEAPEAVAIVADGASLAYGALDARANQVAHALRRLGVGPESVVGLSVPRSPELFVGLLGILKAGGAYLPLDPDYPPERLAHMLEDSRVNVLVTTESLAPTLPETGARLVRLDADRSRLDAEPETAPPVDVPGDALAYQIYTSGSMGRPKGVMVEHRALVNAYCGWEEAYELTTRARRHLQMASFSFDVFTGDWVRALGSGGTLVLCPREHLLEPDRLFTLLRDEAVDIAEFVPAVLRELVKHLTRTGQTLDFMRTVICGSDLWTVAEYARFREVIGPGTRLVNSFGLTEATIDSTWFEAGPGTLAALAPDWNVPIGRPFPNTRLYILGPHDEPVPVGVPGELVIGGAGVARGYRGRANLTAERFGRDPFSGEPDARIYRTGDRARFRRDGNVEFLGRVDHQIKLRGVRIEPGEIERVLEAHESVRNAVILARPRAGADLQLVAWVVPAEGRVVEPEALRAHARSRLPAAMVPSAFVALETLPLTPNGKVDRKALPAPDWSQVPAEELVAPRTDTEHTLARIYGELLGLETVGVTQDFFLLGGHSLLATQLVSRVRDTLGVEMPLRAIFEAPTVAELALRADELRQRASSPDAPPLVPVPRNTEAGAMPEFPLSFAQQRLYFLDRLDPGSAAYVIPDAVRLLGPLEHEALDAALGDVVRRHESLRTAFVESDGQPVQRILPAVDLPLERRDLSALDPTARETAVADAAAAEARRPFDLARPPLVRACLLRLAGEEHVLLLTAHHIVSDGWSGDVLTRELAACYEAHLREETVALPPLPVQYADYAVWQRRWLRGPVLDQELDHWKLTLANTPCRLELPVDRPRPAVRTHAGDYRTRTLSGELTERVRQMSRREGATLFMTLLAAWQVLLARTSGQDDICVGTPVANRTRAETEGLIGFFVNTLVIRGDLGGEEPSFREILGRVRQAALEAFAHQDIPFEQVVDAVRPGRDTSVSPLFQAMFVMQNRPPAPGTGGGSGLRLEPVDSHSGTAKFDVTLFVTEASDTLGCALEFDTDLFEPETAERMLRQFERLLAHVAEQPDAAIAAVPLLDADERRQIIDVWNRTDGAWPEDATVHGLIARAAAARPDAVAVRFASAEGRETTLTCGELDARSNRLARHLSAAGVGPETIVGLCMERRPELVEAILAVLKAGGAYLPLDPAYPDGRIRTMLEDAGARLVLTQASLASRMAGTGTDMRVLDSPTRPWDAGDAGPLPETVGPANLAYLIYTSGSTGRPKGVEIEHRGVVNYLTWCRRTYPVGPGEIVPVHSSIAFDLTVTSLLAPLAAGGTLALVPDAEGLEGLGNLLGRVACGAMKLTPAHMSLLRAQRPGALASRARALVIGGEALRWDAVEAWHAEAPDTVLFNEYGPTETVVGCCVEPVNPRERTGTTVPIGRPLLNTRMYVLDARRAPVPVGVVGEIYVGGVQVARGYRGRPEETATRFLEDPFRPGGRMYRTGDLGRWRVDGRLEFLGRADQQVKVRGFRIEPEEIETALRSVADVADACVVARGDERVRLVAYVVPEDGRTTAPDALRAAVEGRLPDYMIPSAWVTVSALPLTAHGKVDRRALPEPPAPEEATGDVVPPEGETEAALADVWSALLGVPSISRHHSFFDLGGDSILSLQVVARARARGVVLEVRDLFEAPTLADLAARADARAGAETGSGRSVVAPQAALESVHPLAPIQRWFFRQAVEPRSWWNQSVLLVHRGPLDRRALETAVTAVLRRHDALRLRFSRTAGEDDTLGPWRQRHGLESVDRVLAVHDLRGLSPVQARRRVEADAAEAQRSLDLEHGPLARVVYWDLGGEGRLLIVAHHLVVDAVSWRILLADLARAAGPTGSGSAGAQAGTGAALGAKTSPYGVWAERLASNVDAARSEAAYWADVVGDGGLRLPGDRSADRAEAEGAGVEGEAARVEVALGPDETRALLESVGSVWRAKPVEAVLAAIGSALGAWANEADVVVDVEGHGRDDRWPDLDLSETVGWFTALHPLRLAGAGRSPADALRQAKEALRGVPGGGHGWGVLRDVLGDFADRPAPEVVVNYLGRMEGGGDEGVLGPATEARGAERAPAARRTHALDVQGVLEGGRLRLEWVFNAARWAPAEVEAVALEALEALRALVKAGEQADARDLAPSDFSEFGWDADDFEDILGDLEALTDAEGAG